ncbi:cadherin-89D [Fopius arisanus]|uniref:Cadherin-89D n=2 Tax=Fopius arisanus TaxID=64838 RepID=A0A9R1TZ70_9HYME|nr:PREDICTED: cadherin-89D [Fopius arisanus]XP_011302070.1 PREDICTED: cadherin-89D [Fopius arisanus]XP_011302071.1 PREDICTED: cadherin-89D [Fopius arisanus]XP_011302072.1 PREDICTED: cadherin-89D [Fopius arisanus]
MAPDSGASYSLSRRVTKLVTLLLVFSITSATGCQFYPVGEYLKFVRVPENLPLGAEVLSLEVHPRSHLTIMPVDKEEDARYFTYKDLNSTHISVILSQSLEDLVDSETPRNLLKFRFVCDYSDGVNSLTSSHLSVTVYVEDINDHAPQFIGSPYHVTVEEFTSPGMTIFRGIHAFDGDKPNTPNSDVHYAIVEGNEGGKFSLESGHRTALILRRPLDYDTGDRQFSLVITATDRGTPARSASTTVTVNVIDNDDLGPKFTQSTYRARVYESFPFPKSRLHKEIYFTPSIHAKDQDASINAPLKYSIVSGNERNIFQMDSRNGSLFQIQPIDLESERTLSNNTFHLQLHATQMDNPLKFSSARLEIEILDLNDNLPEFEVDHYNISIVENLPNGFSVLQVVAHDQDQGMNGDFTYELLDPSGAFLVDEKSGWLTVRDERVLDRERISLLRMQVIALEKNPTVVPSSNGSSSVPVEITLLDANDNNPIFVPSNVYEFVAKSDARVGTVLGQVKALDSDLGRNGVVRYGLQKAGNSTIVRVPFTVDSRTGVVTVAETPIIVGRHAIFVEAADQPANPSERRFSLAVVTVDVLQSDATGGSLPDFVGSPYEFWVGANVPVGTSVGQIRINSAAEKKRDIIYDLLHSYREGVPFAVEEQTGTITVIDDIDRYVRRSYDFEGVVTNDKNLMLVTNVSVHVVDPNDERELFTKGTTRAPLLFHVRENQAGAFIGQVLPRNNTRTTSNVRFLIANQRDVPDIAITEDGDLYTVRGLDRETRQNYSITVIAETTRGLGIFQVTVVVDDVNDNPPIFSQSSYQGHVEENSPPGTEVVLNNRISTHDADDLPNRKFSLQISGEGSDLFTIDRTTGRIFFGGKGSSVLDREEKSTYNLTIIASDDINSKSTASLTLKITDVNDNGPVFTQMIVSPDKGIVVSKESSEKSKDNSSHNSPLLLIPENVTLGAVIIRLLASDKDAGSNAEITYGIANETISPQRNSDSNPHFIISPRTGELSTVRQLPAGRNIHLTVVAQDSGTLNDTVSVKMMIVDVNDHAPVFNKSWYAFDVIEGIYDRQTIGRITAVDDDAGENARIRYSLEPSWNSSGLRFEVDEASGLLMVTGDLDREVKDTYQLTVIAQDSGRHQQSSTVDVEINVLDSNDNPPEFHGYTDVNVDNSKMIPVFYTSASEDTPPGTIITKVYANDSDFAGNGNGLILFDLPRLIGEKQFFEIDSKDGTVMTIAELDYERQSLHNVTITVRDLGEPSLTATALLFVRVLDVPDVPDVPDKTTHDRPVFQHRYYEVEIEENSVVPLKLIQLNVSEVYSQERMRYAIVSNDSEILDLFGIHPDNGTLVLKRNVDREFRDRYQFRVKVDWGKTGRGMPVMIYPVGGERLGGLGVNEARVVVRVKDANDNAPRFRNKGRPLLAAIPANVQYGHEIIKVEADDPDEGINGEIRYQILGQENSPRFAIDPLSGQVRSVASFSRDAGRVFGFDVKATDRGGADNGRSSIANVFVYVVDDNKQVVLVMGTKPTEIENQVEEITGALQNVTGLDVRVRKLEPHIEKNLIDTTSTDLYLYAVDPHLNSMIDMDTLHSVFRKKKSEIREELERYRVLDIARNTSRQGSRYLLSTLEVGVVVLGCVVFVGALVTALCVACVRRNKRGFNASGNTSGLPRILIP